MKEADYQGPDRRRGGPDRRNPEQRTKILLVDDHALFRMGMRQILEREPERLSEAERQAVQRLIHNLKAGYLQHADEERAARMIEDLVLASPSRIQANARRLDRAAREAGS